jgi:GAF domain-containing protein
MMNKQGLVETHSAPGRPPTGRENQQHGGRQVSGWQAALAAERFRIATRILPIMIGASVILGVAFIVLYFVLGRPWQWIGMILELAWAVVFFLLAYLAARRGHLTPTVYLTTLGILPAVIIGPALIEGMIVAGIMAGVIVIIFARLLAGRTQNRVVVAVSGLAIGIAVLLSGFRVFELLSIPSWIYTTINIVVADMVVLIIAQILDSRDARYEDSLAQAETYARELDAQRATLEERTRDLARRARYQEATAAVARDAASLLDLQALLSRVVTLISEEFGFYHAGIFLLAPSREWAVLQAASSEGGQRMLARAHRLRVGQQGIVGYVTGRNEPRIALDVGEDAVFFDNPDLPDTRSEMALPLRARGEAIGALDVQSIEPAAFGKEDVAVLQTLADQLAVAIGNARLFQQAQESLEAERRAYGELSRQAWAEMVRARSGLGYRYREREVSKIEQDEGAGAEMSSTQLPSLTLPVEYRDQVFGTIVAHKPVGAGEWTPEERALMETLAGQLSIALDSARLYQDTQRAAAEERLTSQITARMRETLDVDLVLQTAIREMGAVLGIPRVEVRMGKGAPLQRMSETGAAGSERAPRRGAEKGKEYGGLD